LLVLIKLLPNPNKRPHALLDLFVKERCLYLEALRFRCLPKRGAYTTTPNT